MTQIKSFVETLNRAIEENDSLLCVGLDPDPYRYPEQFPGPVSTTALVTWGRKIIEQTADLVCCYKPNFAFYEQHGPAGLAALQQTIAAVPPEIPILLDAKRADIGSTAAAYARAAFEVWGAGAVTVNPYLGRDGIAPFLAYPGKMVFVLAYTSNPSAAEVQSFGAGQTRLFEQIIRLGQNWGSPEQIGFVVGATQPHALTQLRRLVPEPYWVLAPGVGAQGGDLTAAVTAGLVGSTGLIVPVSRGVLYAAEPRAAARRLRAQINQARQAPQPPAGPDHSELILGLHEAGCVQFGQFTLASGRQSPIYIDLRRLASRSHLLALAGRAYTDLLRIVTYDHLAAVPYAALPLGTAVALATGRPLIYPRQEAKEHGTGRTVEGIFSAGERVVVIEDLVTSGGSVLNAIDTLEKAGLIVTDVVALIDREQGGEAALAARGYRLQAALRLRQVLECLHQAGQISTGQMTEVERYLES